MIEKRKIQEFTGGWFIGDFEPTLLKSKDFEVSVKTHPAGEIWDKHYHKVATEYNFVISGKVEIDNQIFVKDDIFIIPPDYVVDPTFLEDCTILCVKTPSVKGDKYVIDRT